MGDSVPQHTGPISLTDTHLEPSVWRTRPTTTRRESSEMERPHSRETLKSLADSIVWRRTPLPSSKWFNGKWRAIFRARVRARPSSARIPFSKQSSNRNRSVVQGRSTGR